jgi:hypothetical protein
MNALDVLTTVAIKNGLYIPFLYIGLYFATQDLFLSTTVALKSYTTNYFYWFGSRYHYLAPQYNWIKQFTRFTDTGCIASTIYYISPRFLPLAFNVHFVITFGYWIGKAFFSMQDSDMIIDPILIQGVDKVFSMLNHSLPLMMLIYKVSNSDHECSSLFTQHDIQMTYYWVYTWFLCIYIPWRIYTHDCVYNVLEYKTPNEKKIGFIALIHVLVLIGNATGYLLQPC